MARDRRAGSRMAPQTPDEVVLAVDMGGTKTSLALIDRTGAVLARATEQTSADPPDSVLARLAGRAAALSGSWPIAAVGLAMPAVIDDDGRVAWAAPGVAGWQGFAARDRVEAVFGRPGVVSFDGYAATAGEAVFGAGRGAGSVGTVIVGTGLGAGLYRAGEVLRGAVGVAGAVGWMRWPIDGRLSPPAESVASGPGIVAAARRRARATGIRARYSDSQAVFKAARAGDRHAAAAIRDAVAVAGCAAGVVVSLFAPDVLVWGGGVGSRLDFSRRASAVARRASQPFAARRTRFVRSALGPESSLFGAAVLALARSREESP
jgi:glucokinase